MLTSAYQAFETLEYRAQMFISLFGLFESVKPLVMAERVMILNSKMGSSHSIPLLQLSSCESRTGQMTVFTEECLYMRAHLD
jgi:hypothetical protein